VTKCMRTYTTLEAARRALRDRGGWLLMMGGGVCLVTEDERLVRELRGDEYLACCERLRCRDETLPALERSASRDRQRVGVA
jgi:hypothetical protein